MTPLVQAVLNNDRDMIQALIENGAIMDYRTRLGAFHGNAVNQFGTSWFTPMHVASAENKLIAMQGRYHGF